MENKKNKINPENLEIKKLNFTMKSKLSKSKTQMLLFTSNFMHKNNSISNKSKEIEKYMENLKNKMEKLLQLIDASLLQTYEIICQRQ